MCAASRITNKAMNEIGRRDFLKKSLAAGVLISTAGLPAFAEDNQEDDRLKTFSGRGRFERLSLSYAHIDAGATKPFSILHITDTHLTAAYASEDEKKQLLHTKRTKTFGGLQEKALKDSLAWAKDNVDYILHTGDLIDWISEENLDLAEKYLGEETAFAVGNHEYSRYMWLEKSENTEEYKALSKSLLESRYHKDMSFASQIVNGVNFITLDDTYYYITEEQADLFADEVRKKLPIILCMHVPVYTPDIATANRKFWKAGSKFEGINPAEYKYGKETDIFTEQFFDRLKKEKLLKGILSGHTHFGMEEQFSPTARQYITGPNFLFTGREILFT